MTRCNGRGTVLAELACRQQRIRLEAPDRWRTRQQALTHFRRRNHWWEMEEKRDFNAYLKG